MRSSSRRSALLLAGAAIAFGASEQAQAQAFKGNPTVVSGFATRFPGPNAETIVVESPTAIINWDPTDMAGLGTIDFLPAGSIATFQNGPNNPNFVVLNRIIPLNLTRPVALNGTVIVSAPGAVLRVARPETTVGLPWKAWAEAWPAVPRAIAAAPSRSAARRRLRRGEPGIRSSMARGGR